MKLDNIKAEYLLTDYQPYSPQELIEIKDKIKNILKTSHGKVLAVRYYREKFHCGLKKAKDAVEKIERIPEHIFEWEDRIRKK